VLPLRQCLPAIRVPLRRTDPDAALDLQVLVDQCYERGRYDSAIDYNQPPQPQRVRRSLTRIHPTKPAQCPRWGFGSGLR
jgi:Protein of unknown function (DUF4058)